MRYNHQQDFNTAEDFIDFFQKNQFFRTRTLWDVHKSGRGGHIYRGQADADWDLKPNVFRSHKALDNFTPQPPCEYDQNNKESWLGTHMHAELRSVFIFLETADKLGIETPIDYSRVKDYYEIINSAFNRREYDHTIPFPNDQTLEEFALAQHHGIPTRILDWTESPLIACFFAALDASSLAPENKRIKSKNISVTCFNNLYFLKSDQLVKVNAPRHKNNFLRLQQGVFTHTPKANAFILKKGRWPSVEDIVDETEELHGSLKKYRLPTKEADSILRILYDYGISIHQLMPTLNNISQSFANAAKLFNKTT